MLSRCMQCSCYMFSSKKSRILRVPIFILKTLWVLLRKRPNILVIQCPSVILGCLVGFFKPICGYKLVVDAHNAAVDPDEFYSKLVKFLYRYCQKRCDLIVITNAELEKFIIDKQKIVCLPDKLPFFPDTNHYKVTSKYNIVYICSFSADEPYWEVFEGAKLLTEIDVTIYVTGNYSHIRSELSKITLPSNIQLTGFLSEPEYISLLYSVDMGVVLTERQGCLTCGAYELVSSNKPMVITGTDTIKKYFNFSAVYCENTPCSIASSIRKCINQLPELSQQLENGKTIMQRKWDDSFRKFISRLNEL